MPPSRKLSQNDKWLWNNMDDKTLVGVARLAESMERFQDMMMAMKLLAERKKHLNPEERNLLVVAFKSRATILRGQYRTVLNIAHTHNTDVMAEFTTTDDGRKVSVKEQERQFNLRRQFARQALGHIAGEIRALCDTIIGLISDLMIPSVDGNTEDTVYFMKIRADYYRYIAEASEGEAKKVQVERTENAYNEASKKAQSLPLYNPVRLGLFLNVAVFQYEIHGNQTRAVKVARDTYDKCVSNMTKVPDEQYKDVQMLQGLLRDNLLLWCQQDDDDIQR